jgi:diadenosine tetraphosphate (Ap4A) HIT family hydrolase
MHCAFCELPQVKARTILENDIAWVFPSYLPIAPAHLLVCPKRCVPTYEDLRTEEREAMFELMTKVKPALRQAYGAEGFNYAWNEGKIADQSVPHIHIHLLSRVAGDKEKLGFDPKATFYENEPGMLTEEEISLIRDQLKRYL